MSNPTDPRGRRKAPRSRKRGGKQSRKPHTANAKSGRQRRDEGPLPTPPQGQDLVLVRFKGNRKGFYNNSRGVPVRTDQYCLVEADRGRDMGRVSYIGPGKPAWWREALKQGVLESAKPRDLERLHQNRGDEWEFWDICQEKIQARRLNMNLVSVERQFDHNKITFYFTAEKRVDFRELVRDLAAIFRTRIELRQIGVRDEARLKGGMGICGREFCCSTFLHDFIPVTLKMAKDQQLPLNPSKLSGLCGRLRCCLTFEHSSYKRVRQVLPAVGCQVKVDGREGVVRKLDLVRELVIVEFAGDRQTVTRDARDVVWEPRDAAGRSPDKKRPGRQRQPNQNRDKQQPPRETRPGPDRSSRQDTKQDRQTDARPKRQQPAQPGAPASEQPASANDGKRRGRRRRRRGGRR